MQSLTCRNCGSNQTYILPIGVYEPFFRLRVDTSKDEFLTFSRENSIPIGRRPLYERALRKAKRIMAPQRLGQARQFRTSMQFCSVCHGLSPCHEYTYEDLMGMYRDYRLESYVKDRISLEGRWYERIADQVGSHPLELKNRNTAVDGFLRRNASYFAGGQMIDYAGGDGRFIPPYAFEQFEHIHILDASEVPIHPSVDARKVTKVPVANPGSYDFMTCMHFLEHIGNPRQFVVESSRLLVPGGLMYIEVPLELTEEVYENCLQRFVDKPIGLHEHINLFDRTSIRALVRSIEELDLIDDSEGDVDLGWITGNIGRFLVRKAK